MNIVRINEAVFKAMDTAQRCGMCWSFTYARKDYANLKKGGHGCCVQVFLTKFKKRTNRDSQGLVEYVDWIFEMNILLDSLFDIQMFNELEPDDAKSKFADYVEPILDCFGREYDNQLCILGYSLINEEIEADYNKFDQNKDGIFYRATVRDES